MACQSVRNKKPPTNLHLWSWPTCPWQRIHFDFAGPFLGSMFLIVIDAHSKWIEATNNDHNHSQYIRHIRPSLSYVRCLLFMGCPSKLSLITVPNLTEMNLMISWRRMEMSICLRNHIIRNWTVKLNEQFKPSKIVWKQEKQKMGICKPSWAVLSNNTHYFYWPGSFKAFLWKGNYKHDWIY